jgi:hypothetical protein
MTVELFRTELKVGDILIGKVSQKRFLIKDIIPGMGGSRFPFLVLECDGVKYEHDTSFDSYSQKYTVERNNDEPTSPAEAQDGSS